MQSSTDDSGRARVTEHLAEAAPETHIRWRASLRSDDAATRVRPSPRVVAGELTVHLVNPSHISFGVGVITPRWLFAFVLLSKLYQQMYQHRDRH
jgi:hypothetical protein